MRSKAQHVILKRGFIVTTLLTTAIFPVGVHDHPVLVSHTELSSGFPELGTTGSRDDQESAFICVGTDS